VLDLRPWLKDLGLKQEGDGFLGPGIKDFQDLDKVFCGISSPFGKVVGCDFLKVA
jgi:hypothetical protein